MTIDGTINLPTLLTFFVTFAAAVAWMVRLEGRVTANARDTTDNERKIEAINGLVLLLEKQLAEYKTHVAEHYATKKGMAEQTDRIMKGLADLGGRLDGLGSRLDRIYDGAQATRTARRSGGG